MLMYGVYVLSHRSLSVVHLTSVSVVWSVPFVTVDNFIQVMLHILTSPYQSYLDRNFESWYSYHIP